VASIRDGCGRRLVQAGLRAFRHAVSHLAFLEAGDFFGEMSVFEKEVRSATVRAVGEARVLKVDKKTLLRRIREDPLLAVNLLKTMSHRIRSLNVELARHKDTQL
jgi:CRP-like cAMP-binding protein